MTSNSTDPLINSLARAVETNWDRQVLWLQKLVRFPSLRGTEADCQKWVAAEFDARGWDVDCYSLADVSLESRQKFATLTGVDPSQSLQVVARIVGSGQTGSQDARSLILQGHVDVVPTGPREMWDRDPFSGEISGDWLHGRGAQDMKTGISALVFALEAISTAGLRLDGTVYLQIVTEEESTGSGALSALLRGYRAQACLIPEPTDNTLIRAQCGAVWFQVSIRAMPSHVEAMTSHENTITASLTIVRALQDLAARMNAKARSHDLFKDALNPIKFNPGIIRGGEWASSTPAWCDVECRLGLLPGDSVHEVKRQIAETVDAAVRADPFLTRNPPKLVWNGFQAEGAVLAPGSVAENVLSDCHQQIFGTSLRRVVSNAVNDTRYYNRDFHIPGLCYGPAGQGLHSVNERAHLPNLKKTTLVLALFVAKWCGLTS